MTLLRRFYALSIIPIVAILLALLCGAILIILTSPASHGSLDFLLPIKAYEALLEGATGISFLDTDGDTTTLAISLIPSAQALTNTLVRASPLILTGLAVGLGFKAGLFNIGGNGQVLVGAFFAALTGAALAQQPVPIALTVAVLAGAIGGALYGFIPGALKAFTGAHEVVVTIMLNSLAAFAIVGLVNDIFWIQGPSFKRTADVGNAAMPCSSDVTATWASSLRS
jgi:simple sugar transport system permease protein